MSTLLIHYFYSIYSTGVANNKYWTPSSVGYVFAKLIIDTQVINKSLLMVKTHQNKPF